MLTVTNKYVYKLIINVYIYISQVCIFLFEHSWIGWWKLYEAGGCHEAGCGMCDTTLDCAQSLLLFTTLISFNQRFALIRYLKWRQWSRGGKCISYIMCSCYKQPSRAKVLPRCISCTPSTNRRWYWHTSKCVHVNSKHCFGEDHETAKPQIKVSKKISRCRCPW